MPTAFTVLKRRLLRASTRLSAGQSVCLSLPLSPPGAGGGQSLPSSPASGTNCLLPVSLPAFLGAFHKWPLSLSSPPRPSLLTSCPKRGGRLLGLASSPVVSLCCIQLPPSRCISSFDVLLAICLSIFHAEPNLTAACRECLYVVAQPKKILSCLINYHLKVTSPPLLRK